MQAADIIGIFDNNNKIKRHCLSYLCVPLDLDQQSPELVEHHQCSHRRVCSHNTTAVLPVGTRDGQDAQVLRHRLPRVDRVERVLLVAHLASEADRRRLHELRSIPSACTSSAPACACGACACGACACGACASARSSPVVAPDGHSRLREQQVLVHQLLARGSWWRADTRAARRSPRWRPAPFRRRPRETLCTAASPPADPLRSAPPSSRTALMRSCC